MLAVLRAEQPRVAIVDQGVDVAIGNGVNAAATPAVAAVRPAARNELLAPKARDAIAAVAGDDLVASSMNFISAEKTKAPPYDRACGEMLETWCSASEISRHKSAQNVAMPRCSSLCGAYHTASSRLAWRRFGHFY
jgi:hypothetical protein